MFIYKYFSYQTRRTILTLRYILLYMILFIYMYFETVFVHMLHMCNFLSQRSVPQSLFNIHNKEDKVLHFILHKLFLTLG